MFKINKYKYIDRDTRNKFDIYARTVEFADNLVARINAMGVFNLRRAKIFFITKMLTEIPPYDVEQEQIENIERWEEQVYGKTKKGE